MAGLKSLLDAQYLLFKLLNRQALFAYDARHFERAIAACNSAVNENGFKRYEARLAYALKKEAKAKKRHVLGKGPPARGANFPLLDDWDFQKISFGRQ